MPGYINKKYILWSLASIPILSGVSLVVRHDVIRLPLAVSDKAEVTEDANKNIVATPDIVKAIYLTSSSGGSEKKIGWLIDLAGRSELNAVVIDIKDFSGYISYDSGVADADKYGTEKIIIKDIDSLIKRLHDNGIYVIARMTVFQDPALVKARPDRAVQNRYTKRPWTDRKGLSWIDPSCRECWAYYASIAKDALGRGFDEVNMDYIRFPSDGDMSALEYPFWKNDMTKPQILNEFFKYMRLELGDSKMSADLFGFVTTRKEDFGVGQVIEDAFEYFDYVSPMVYPSHYPPNFLGFANPAERPYEVIYHTMSEGQKRLDAFYEATGNRRAKLRPWLQDFKLGAEYTQAMVEAEIKATQDALGDRYNGYMLWNASNNYHEGVFRNLK